MELGRYILLLLFLFTACSQSKRRLSNRRNKHSNRNHSERSGHINQIENNTQNDPPKNTSENAVSSRHNHHTAQPHPTQETPLEREPENREFLACPNCEQLQIHKDRRLAEIKNHVLTATGLLTPPNMTGVVISQNPNILGIIDEMTTGPPPTSFMQESPYSDEEPPIKTEKIFYPVEAAPSDLNISPDMDVLYFRVDLDHLSMRAKRAILHVWLKPVQSELDTVIPISVFKVTRPDNPSEYIVINEVTTVYESFDAQEGNWVKIGVYKLLQEWLESPIDNLGLVVVASDFQGRNVAVTNPQESAAYVSVNTAPLLEVHTEEGRRSRSRRNSDNNFCTNTMMETRCCRYKLTVNFVKLGWDFIVAPKIYDANFCNGDCPYLYAHKYAHSTLIQKMNSTSAKHGPCCGARKLSPMKMLYYDHVHKIKFDTIQDMVVDRCGCS